MPDPSATQPPGGSKPQQREAEGTNQEPQTKEYTVKSITSGIKMEDDHVAKTFEVDGDSYGVGDKVQLQEYQAKSLRAMGVRFESDPDE